MTDKPQYRDLLKDACGRGYKGGKSRLELEAFLAGAAIAAPLPKVDVVDDPDVTYEIIADADQKPPAQEPHPSDPRDEQRPTDREVTGRAARVPLGGSRLKLKYAQRPGFWRYWFNDQGSRIQDAQGAGYEFVEETVDGRRVKVSRRVGTHEDGSSMTAHLMEIRQEFHDEDQAAKRADVDEIDNAIKGGEPRGGTSESDRYYTPTEGTSVRAE